MWNFLFEITSEDSPSCGEEFFVQTKTFKEAEEVIDEIFPNEHYIYHGRYTDLEAETMGLDTY